MPPFAVPPPAHNVVVRTIATFISSFDPPSKNPEKHWYLSPEEHVVDCFFWIPLFVSICLWAWWVERRNRASRPLSSGWPVSPFAVRVNRVLSMVLAVCLMCQVYYKYHRGNLAMVYMLQPCHVAALFYVYLLQAPRSRANGLVFNVATQFFFFTVLAIAVPDTSQLNQLFEYQVFWIEHWVLLLAPLYLICVQVFPLYDDYACYLHALGWGGLFFYLVQLPFALVSGVNLNYMLWPPPNQPINGPYYRYYMGMFLVVVSFVSGRLLPRALVALVNSMSSGPPKHSRHGHHHNKKRD